jgi:hypothetical protein
MGRIEAIPTWMFGAAAVELLPRIGRPFRNAACPSDASCKHVVTERD